MAYAEPLATLTPIRPEVGHLKRPTHGNKETAAVLPTLTLDTLVEEAATFAKLESTHDEPTLFGVDNGKTVGTYLEHKFILEHLKPKYALNEGNSALGIDLPILEVDIKVTSITQPQSSCPFKSARQKIFGLGYHLIVFVYEKTDNATQQTARLDIKHAIFVDKSRTADYQMTRGLREIIERDGNADDLVAFMQDKNLPVEEIEARNIAEEALKDKPMQGYLTISNALQWRLQYSRVIVEAGKITGLRKVR